MPSPSVYSGQKEGSLAHFFCTSALWDKEAALACVWGSKTRGKGTTRLALKWEHKSIGFLLRKSTYLTCVARSRQVCIYVVEALLITIYLPEERADTYRH
jgi:hypothetical protein